MSVNDQPRVWITDWGRSKSGLNERADCTVRAIAAALDLRYTEAHAKLASLGRKPRSGFKIYQHLAVLGLEQRADLSCRRLDKVLPALREGRFIIRVAHHVFAVVGGTVLDLKPPKLKARVKMVYQHEPRAEVAA